MRESTRQATRGLTLAALAALVFAAPGLTAGQPLTDRTVNLEGTGVPGAHDLAFDFAHRFEIAGDAGVGDVFDDGKVVNYPTFGMAYGIGGRAAIGARYSTNSLIAGRANEWQPYAKVVPALDLLGSGTSVSVLAGWNAANESVDGEASLQRDFGRLRTLVAVRGFSSPLDREAVEDEAEWAVAGGARLALNEHLALVGDYANMISEPSAQVAWSAGVAARIPYTPHTLGLYATNVTSGTLEGLSVGLDDGVFWGFSFTVPLGGERWGRIFDPAPAPRERAAPPTATGSETAGPAPSGPVVVVEIRDLKFHPAEVTVAPGTTVRWVNEDPLAHTSTAEGAWDSGLLEPGAAFERTFGEPGRHDYLCTPHPFMKGVVVVAEGGSR